MITRLLVAILAILGLLPMTTSAQQPFDYEKAKAERSVREYTLSKLPARGYD